MVIRKLPGQRKWRLYSKKTGRNLGTFNSKKAAVKHEKDIHYFEHR